MRTNIQLIFRKQLQWRQAAELPPFPRGPLQSQNILLARDGTAKVADVGLARVLNRDYVTSLDMAGTFAWAAPELLLGARCTEKACARPSPPPPSAGPPRPRLRGGSLG